MNSIAVNLEYGAFELRGLYQKHLMESLLIAAAIHFTLFGGIRAYTFFNHTTDDVIRIPWDKNILIMQPPSFQHPVIPHLSVATQFLKPSNGIPVPIPDAQISPEATIEKQDQMNQPLEIEHGGNKTNSVYIPNETTISDNDTPPEIFTSVEKQPIPIFNPPPVYPEIARRAGIEGTVWIKMWVTKEGKVKKSEIVKSDAALFEESSLTASRQWIFTPAIMNNGPVAVWVTVPFRFRLHN